LDQIKRIVAFGCSNTYGQGLPDCDHNINKDSKPSIHAWPSALGEMLDVPVENRAYPGASNKEICSHIVRYDFQEGDLAVIGWTYMERSCIIVNDVIHPLNGRPWIKQLGLYGKSAADKVYQRHFLTDENVKLESEAYISYAYRYIEKTCNYIGFKCCLDNYNLRNLSDEILDIDYFMLLRKHGRCPDNFHPSEKSHQAIAKKIKKAIKII